MIKLIIGESFKIDKPCMWRLKAYNLDMWQDHRIIHADKYYADTKIITDFVGILDAHNNEFSLSETKVIVDGGTLKLMWRCS